jgi:hypothetical protein
MKINMTAPNYKGYRFLVLPRIWKIEEEKCLTEGETSSHKYSATESEKNLRVAPRYHKDSISQKGALLDEIVTVNFGA